MAASLFDGLVQGFEQHLTQGREQNRAQAEKAHAAASAHISWVIKEAQEGRATGVDITEALRQKSEIDTKGPQKAPGVLNSLTGQYKKPEMGAFGAEIDKALAEERGQGGSPEGQGMTPPPAPGAAPGGGGGPQGTSPDVDANMMASQQPARGGSVSEQQPYEMPPVNTQQNVGAAGQPRLAAQRQQAENLPPMPPRTPVRFLSKQQVDDNIAQQAVRDSTAAIDGKYTQAQELITRGMDPEQAYLAVGFPQPYRKTSPYIGTTPRLYTNPDDPSQQMMALPRRLDGGNFQLEGQDGVRVPDEWTDATTGKTAASALRVFQNEDGDSTVVNLVNLWDNQDNPDAPFPGIPIPSHIGQTASAPIFERPEVRNPVDEVNTARFFLDQIKTRFPQPAVNFRGVPRPQDVADRQERVDAAVAEWTDGVYTTEAQLIEIASRSPDSATPGGYPRMTPPPPSASAAREPEQEPGIDTLIGNQKVITYLDASLGMTVPAFIADFNASTPEVQTFWLAELRKEAAK